MTGAAAARTVLAVDLGGTKTACALVREDGTVLVEAKEKAARGGASATAAQVADMAGKGLASLGLGRASLAGAGVIVPGIYDPTTGRAWAPNLWGDAHVPLAEELSRLVSMPVHVDSDRVGYVLGERWCGVACGLDDVVFLAVGTGIGAGLVCGGRVVRGARGIAGAVGWFALRDGLRDEYARMGCFEAEAAGPALARKAGFATAEEAVAAARGGHEAARRAVADVGAWLARGVANLISAFDPDMVVLGGGLMQAGDLFLPLVREGLRPWAQPLSAPRTRIELSSLGERAGLLGAARLALASGEV
ncbi:MAG TPA: ROK family protein [Vicinamibacteria bacterium]|nr:ROK family protein [Vicinamibacteria bacterium]